MSVEKRGDMIKNDYDMNYELQRTLIVIRLDDIVLVYL